MNTKNNKRKKESKIKIENTFLELIKNKEIEEITITDICKISRLNRTTFYANYSDVYDLIEKVKDRMADEFASLYVNNTYDFSHENSHKNYLKMFKHIKDNQEFYKIYFKLESATFISPVKQFDKEAAKKYYNNEHIDYHIEFFRAGLNAIIKKWLNNNCKETPEEIANIIKSEYNK